MLNKLPFKLHLDLLHKRKMATRPPMNMEATMEVRNLDGSKVVLSKRFRSVAAEDPDPLERVIHELRTGLRRVRWYDSDVAELTVTVKVLQRDTTG